MSKRIRTSQRQNDDAEPGSGTPSEEEQNRYNGLDVWEHMQSLSKEEWSEHVVYVYRVEPKLQGQSTRGALCSKVNEAIDENWVKEHFGGTVFDIYFNRIRPTDKKFSRVIQGFTIAAEPKIYAGQALKASTSPMSQLNGSAPASTTSITSPDKADEVVGLLRDVLNRKDQTPQDAMKASLEILNLAKNIGKPDGPSSTTGNPMMDKLVEAMLLKMANPPDQNAAVLAIADKLERAIEKMGSAGKQTDVFDLMTKLGGMMPIILQFFDADSMGDIWKRLTGNAQAASPITVDGKGKPRIDYMELFKMAAEKGPELIQAFDQMSQHNMQRQLQLLEYQRHVQANPVQPGQPAAAPPAQVIPPPAPHAPAAATPPGKVITMQPAAADAAPVERAQGASVDLNGFGTPREAAPPPQVNAAELQATLESDDFKMAQVLMLITRSYRTGDDGDDCAGMLIDYFPEVMAKNRALFTMVPHEQVMMWCASNPVLADIAKDQAFPKFIEKFMDEVKEWEPEGEAAPQAGPVPVA